ncbi:uncharacterized protein LAESUDRAFT_718453 [Laetiporus sulphureus 93-53]|uniref:Uncharacterized protein n=1 Tax=Laetiporus sulphureus 93-53 TaxID=1314785 RepID=A0A165AY42_9APHY|nr:uncharacterized protein LAESUDRAFT_718453 [Laetiporus sulphureus 93-53]KZS99876.1 hypothetical protein LAESUDRAFT_718453 [Laetiporus sulphureus 93-53]
MMVAHVALGSVIVVSISIFSVRLKNDSVDPIEADDNEELALLELPYVLLLKKDQRMNVVDISHPNGGNHFTCKSYSRSCEIIDLDDFKEWAEQQKANSMQMEKEDGKSASMTLEKSNSKGKDKVPANPQSCAIALPEVNKMIMMAKHLILLFLKDMSH